MELFSDYDLNQRVSRINTKIVASTDPNRDFDEITENGISIAQGLLNNTRDDLEYIKNKVGLSNESYIEVSGAIALAAAACIQFPVSMMMLPQTSAKEATKIKLGQAARLMAQVSSMHMTYETRQLINRVTQKITQAESNINGGSSGCFIATFVYQNYDAKEVLILRYYRDTVLVKSRIGTTFIKVYYFISPTLVKLLSYIPSARKILKIALDKITIIIMKQ